MQSYILIAYVHDRPGVLTKIASIFYRRGMNIVTLTVGQTTQAEVSKIVFRVIGKYDELKRLLLSVNNLIDVINVDIKDDNASTARELCLARVQLQPGQNESALHNCLTEHGARVLERDNDSVVIEMVDAPTRIDAFIAALSVLNVVDLSRTGATAMPRGLL